MIKCLRKLIHKNKIADLLIKNYDFRTVVFLSFSFVGNLAYAIFNIVVYGLTDSLWCGAMALLQHLSESHTGKTDVTAPVSCVFSMYPVTRKKSSYSSFDQPLMKMWQLRSSFSSVI